VQRAMRHTGRSFIPTPLSVATKNDLTARKLRVPARALRARENAIKVTQAGSLHIVKNPVCRRVFEANDTSPTKGFKPRCRCGSPAKRFYTAPKIRDLFVRHFANDCRESDLPGTSI
jgi:hypothetical protein